MQKSFERAVFDGDVSDPNGQVVDESGTVVEPGNQDYGHIRSGRGVRTVYGEFIGNVVDYQISADISGKTAFERPS
jgi:hypothetical protein